MPLYEYRCSSCDHRFEVLQRLGDGSEGLSCPDCGDAEVAKQFSTFAASSPGESSAMAAAPAGGCCRGTPT